MKKEETIDYLQFTFPEIPDFLGAYPYPGGSPLAFYKMCYEFGCGTRVYTGNNKSDKFLVQMPGKACERHQMTQYPGRLQLVLDRKCHFSRVDLAVTVDSLEPLRKFREALTDGEVKSERYENSEPKMITDGLGIVETIYVGSLRERSRKGVFRAYDKGKDLGIEAMLTRFELEVRRKAADTAIKRFLLDISIGRLIREVVDLPFAKWWKKIMGEGMEPLPRYTLTNAPDDPVERRWHWLNEQVAPALAKLMLLDTKLGTENHARFVDRVHSEMLKATMLDKE